MRSPQPDGREWPLRAIALASYLISIGAMSANWLHAGKPITLLPIIAVEVFTLILIASARRAEQRDMSWSQMAAATFTSAFFVLLVPTTGHPPVVEAVASTLEVAGLLLSVAAKVWLGRSFGILPAARGLKTRGPYRLVRHPMYAGYALSNLGFLAANPSGRNLAVVMLLLAVQVLRIHREERVLASSSAGPAWTGYAERVRYRVLPGIY